MDSKRNISHLLLIGLMLLGQQLFAQRFAGLTIIGNELGSKSFNEQQITEAFKAKNNFWSNGKALAVCLPETKTSDAGPVCQKVYGKTVSEVQKFWLRI
jgi:hypothetical protein